MRNAEIAAAMTELATLYELDGAVRYRVIAYREAARVIEGSPVSVADLARAGRATELPGIGETLQGKIVDLVETGEIPAAAKLKAKFPASLVEVTRIPGLGAKTARRLFDELGVASLDDLRAAAEAQKLRDVKGLGPKFESGVIEALDRLGEEGAPGRLLLSKVLPVAEKLAEALREHPACERVAIAGSARRLTETCKDIDLIATATDPVAVATALAEHPLAAQAGTAGAAGTRIVTFDGVSVDLRIVEPKAYGNLLQHFTGSAQHNVDLRERAVRKGLSVSEHGVTDVESGSVALYDTEAEVYERLGLAYIEPELREGRGEIAAAANGKLPPPGRARRPARRPALPHDALGRAQLARRDGRGGASAGLRVSGGHRPLRQPRVRQRRHGRGAARADRGGRRLQRRVEGALHPARRVGGQHPAGRLARLRARGPRAARLGDRQRPYRLPDLEGEDDRAVHRRDREPAGRLHRAPHRPPDRPAGAV